MREAMNAEPIKSAPDIEAIAIKPEPSYQHGTVHGVWAGALGMLLIGLVFRFVAHPGWLVFIMSVAVAIALLPVISEMRHTIRLEQLLWRDRQGAAKSARPAMPVPKSNG